MNIDLFCIVIPWHVLQFSSRCLLCAYFLLASKHRIEVPMPSVKLTKTAVDNSNPDVVDWFLWDTELAGFGLKIAMGGRKSYVCQYRTAGGRTGDTRRLTIGVHGSP